jgi:hypothetical protein
MCVHVDLELGRMVILSSQEKASGGCLGHLAGARGWGLRVAASPWGRRSVSKH